METTTWLIAIAFHLLFWLSSQSFQKSIVDKLPRTKSLALMFLISFAIIAGYNLFFGDFSFEKNFGLIGLVGFINAYGAYCQWQAYECSFSKTALFFSAPGVIVVILSAFLLGEKVIYNSPVTLGVIFLFIAAFLLSKQSNRENTTNNAIQWKWLLFVLGMVLIQGGTIFMMKFFSATVPRSIFLFYWYGGTFLGTLLLLLLKKEREKLFQKGVWKIPLASLGLVGSLAMVYWAFQLAPAGIVEPIRRFGMTFLPILVGWFIFKERKGLTKEQILGFVLGLIGASLVILSIY